MCPDNVKTLLDSVQANRATQTGSCVVLCNPDTDYNRGQIEQFSTQLNTDDCHIYRTRFYDQSTCSENPFRDLLLALLEKESERDISSIISACNKIVSSHNNKAELLSATCHNLLGQAIPKSLAGYYSALTHSKRLHVKAQLLCELVRYHQSSRPVVLILEELQFASSDHRKVLKDILQLVAQIPVFIIATTSEVSQALAPLLENALLFKSGTNATTKIEIPSTTGLDSKDTLALNTAAVLGTRFSEAALATLIDDPQYRADKLIERELFVRKRNTLEFKYIKQQQAIYHSLPDEFRHSCHRAAAAYYLFGNAVMYAYHLVTLADSGASHACLTAALSLRDEYKLDQACLFFDKCIALAEDTADRFQAASLKAKTLLDAKEFTQAVQAYDSAQRLTPDIELQAQAWLGMAIALLQRKHHHTACQLLERAKKILVHHPDHNLLASYYYYVALGAEQSGQPDRAITANKIAFEHARDANSTYWQAEVALSIGRIELARLNSNLAYSNLQFALNLARENSFRLVELAALIALARIRIYRLELREALSDLNSAMQLANILDDKEMLLQTQILLAHYDLLRGQYSQMIQHATLAAQLCRYTHTTHSESYAHKLCELAHYQAKQEPPLFSSSQTPSSLQPAIQALISEDRETALLCLINAQHNLARLSNLEALEFCFFAIEACIKHAMWDTGEELADHIIMRMQTEPLPLFIISAERIRLLAKTVHEPQNTTLRVEIFDLLMHCKKTTLRYFLPEFEKIFKQTATTTEPF